MYAEVVEEESRELAIASIDPEHLAFDRIYPVQKNEGEDMLVFLSASDGKERTAENGVIFYEKNPSAVRLWYVPLSKE